MYSGDDRGTTENALSDKSVKELSEYNYTNDIGADHSF